MNHYFFNSSSVFYVNYFASIHILSVFYILILCELHMIVFLWVSGVCASPGDSINPETRKWKEIQGNTTPETDIRGG